MLKKKMAQHQVEATAEGFTAPQFARVGYHVLVQYSAI